MTPEEMDFIRQSIESHDRQLGELVDRQAENAKQIAENARQIGDLTDAAIILRDGIVALDRHVNAVVETLGKIALIVDRHETRIQGLEGRS
jgi:transcription termination factor Rho